MFSSGSASFSQIILYLLFALSGFSALTYEILWSKYLSLTLGNTMTAVSIVAAAFMAGLALGSYLLGRHADRASNPLKLYAALEIAIALSALAFPTMLQWIKSLHVYLDHFLASAPTTAIFCRFLLVGLLLLIPTTCMGGTLPVMVRLFSRNNISPLVGRLYATNTLGAVFGCLGSGFVLIPTLGLSTTGYLAAAINLIIACAALALVRNNASLETPQCSPKPVTATLSDGRGLLLTTIALIGALSLAYEILWTRLFLLYLGNTTYAFSIILGIYLTGLSLGGAVYARWLYRFQSQKLLFWLVGVMALFLAISSPFYDRLADIFLLAHRLSGTNWWMLISLSLLIVSATLLVPTLLSGALLPTVVDLLSPQPANSGKCVGLVLLFNTLGAVAGSIGAVFILLPRLGLQGSFQLTIGLNFLLALCIYFPLRRAIKSPLAAPLLLASLCLIFFSPTWDQMRINSGIYYYAPGLIQAGGIDGSDQSIIDVIEGPETTVAVLETAQGDRFFRVNGKTDGGTGGDMSTQVLLGQLPMLLHRAPRRAMVIGLGTGATLREVGRYPAKEIDCIEISPEVIQAAHHFVKTNGAVLDDPRVNLHQADARELLSLRSERYDVIISEPSNPWQTGNANLFTSDFYALAASRLNKDGIFCQWFPLYDLPLAKIRSALATFLDSFPNCHAFLVNNQLILLGSETPLYFDYLATSNKMTNSGIDEVLNSIGIDTIEDLFAKHYQTNQQILIRLAADADLNSDDHPVLEFSRQMGFNTAEQNLKAFSTAQAQEPIQPLPLVNLGSSPEAVARTLHNMARSFHRAGRINYAMQLLEAAERWRGAAIDKAIVPDTVPNPIP